MSFWNSVQRGASIESRELSMKGQASVVSHQYAYQSWLKFGSTGKNWSIEVGDIHANGIVASVGTTLIQKIAQGKPMAAKRDRTGTLNKADKEDMQARDLLYGMPFGENVWKILGISLAFYGMAYIRKIRAGRTVEAYVPYMASQVKETTQDGRFKYQMTKHGGTSEFDIVDPEDVIPIGYGIPDPRNPLVYISPLMMMLREICTENEAMTFLASVLGSGGAGVGIVFPKGSVGEKERKGWVSRVREAIKTYTRDRSGEPYVAPEEIGYQQIGFNAQQMQVSETALLMIAKICSALGVDPMAAGLPSENKTYANYGEARKALIEDTVLPLWKIMLDTIKPHFVSDGFWVGSSAASVEYVVDLGCYPELNDDKFKISDDLRNDFKTGLLTLGQWYKAKGYTDPKLINDDRRYWDMIAASRPAAGIASRYSLKERRDLERLHSES